MSSYARIAWAAAAESTLTPQERRTIFLADFVHDEAAPGGIENMTAEKFKEVFGEATAQRYEENRRQKRDAAFDPQALSFLNLLRQAKSTAMSIADTFQRMADTAGLKQPDALLIIEAWKKFPDSNTPAELDRLKKHRTESLQQRGPVKGHAKKIIDLLKEPHIREMIKALDTDRLEMGTEKDHGSGEKKRLNFILKTESQFNQQMLAAVQKNEPDRTADIIAARLDSVKAHAASGIFCTDDLMRIAVGEPAFSEGLSKRLKNLITDNYKHNQDNAYYAFYDEFQKILPGLITATFGQTLFAFNDTKQIQDWTTEDIIRLEQFADSRYQILHDVFEKLANKKTNPLGRLENMEISGLAHEILRSTLYPDWRLEIRVGLGGSEQQDPLIRACAYIIGPLHFMQVLDQVNTTFRENGKNGINIPKLVVFDGSALAVEVNEIDPEAAKQNGQNFLKLLKNFVGHFFPAMQPHVTMRQAAYNEVFDNEIFPLLREAARDLLSQAKERVLKDKGEFREDVAKKATPQDITIVEFFKTLTDQAKEHDRGNRAQTSDVEYRERALCYAAAHLMPSVFGTIGEGFTHPVLKWGGQGEAAFDELQRRVLGFLFGESHNLNGMTFPHAVGSKVNALCTNGPVGEKPPYYHDKTDYDLGLKQTQKAIEEGNDPGSKFDDTSRTITSLARKDMMILLATREVGGWTNFGEFLLHCTL